MKYSAQSLNQAPNQSSSRTPNQSSSRTPNRSSSHPSKQAPYTIIAIISLIFAVLAVLIPLLFSKFAASIPDETAQAAGMLIVVFGLPFQTLVRYAIFICIALLVIFIILSNHEHRRVNSWQFWVIILSIPIAATPYITSVATQIEKERDPYYFPGGIHQDSCIISRSSNSHSVASAIICAYEEGNTTVSDIRQYLQIHRPSVDVDKINILIDQPESSDENTYNLRTSSSCYRDDGYSSRKQNVPIVIYQQDSSRGSRACAM